MTLFTKKDENGKSGINRIRVIESIIISLGTAALLGLVSYLLLIPTIKTELQYIRKDIGEIKEITGNHETRIRETEIRIAAHTGKNNGRH